MGRKPWMLSLFVGSGVMVLGASFGRPWVQLVFQTLMFLAACMTFYRLVTTPRSQRTLWLSIFAVLVLHSTSYGGRLLFTSWWPTRAWQPTPADWIDLVAVAMTIIIAHSMFTIRSGDRDPTTVLDALILTTGVAGISWIGVVLPYLHDARFSTGGRALQTLAALLALGAVFVVSRLLMAPVTKSASFHLLGLAACLGMASQVAGLIEGSPEGTFVVLFGGLAMTAVGSFALSPPAITQVGHLQLGERITWRRLTLMTIAAFVAPVLLVGRVLFGETVRHEVVGLVVTWLIGISLAVMRLVGLVQARERVVVNKEVLRHAAVAFAKATTRADLDQALMQHAHEIVTTQRTTCHIALFAQSHLVWRVTESVGKLKHSDNQTCVQNAMQQLLEETPASNEPLARQSEACEEYSACFLTRIPASLALRDAIAVVLATAVPLRNHDLEAITALVNVFCNAVEALNLTVELHERRSAARFQALVRNASDISVVMDESGTISYITPSVSYLLGHAPNSLLGKNIAALVDDNEVGVIRQLVAFVLESSKRQTFVEVRATTKGGMQKHLELTVTDYRDEPTINGLVVNAHDVTDRKRLEEDLRHHVLHDALTGMANRILFMERIQLALAPRRSPRSPFAVLVIGIDDFSMVNDALGSAVGDELLKVLAFRLESFTRTADSAARLGSDVFAVLVEDVVSRDAVEAVADRIGSVIREPVRFDKRDVTVNVSIGIAMSSSDIHEADVLIRNAEIAMHYAKQTGKNSVQRFDQRMHEQVYEKLEFKAELEGVLDRDELRVVYQPLVDIDTGELYGFEALLRWEHPQHGIVSPLTFLPLAEESKTIIPIGDWVARESMTQIASWQQRDGFESLHININVSPVQLAEQGFALRCAATAAEVGISPENVTFEITETAGVSPTACSEIQELRNNGFGIAADDFGTGFANYASLRDIPFTVVKIDRSLIAGLGSVDGADAQVRSVIDMAHALGIKITAEGIEDELQFAVLRSLGADRGQGWLLGKPLDADAVPTYFEAHMPLIAQSTHSQ